MRCFRGNRIRKAGRNMSILDQFIKKIRTTLKNNVTDKVEHSVNNAINNSKRTIKFDNLPESVDDLKALPGGDLSDPFATAALTIAALCEFPKDREACIAMLNYLKGPRPLSPMESQFIADRFMDGVDYIPRSYLAGSTVENDYTPSVPYSIDVWELAHSKDNYSQGYLRLFVNSAGADSPRYIDLRLKPSTQQWFLWEYGGILSGVRVPQSKNEWA